jgi:repressor LexA
MAARKSNKQTPPARGRRPIRQITPSQERVLRAVARFIRKHNYPPTLQELADGLSLAGPSVYEQVNQLVKKGYLQRDAGKARGLKVLRQPDGAVAELVAVPIVGAVAAGSPILAEENIIGEILVEGALAAQGRLFGLRVRGESMLGAGIHHRDVVIVRRQPLAEHGDIVVATVDGDATVKRLFVREGQIELRPENPKHRPIAIGPDTDLRIVGKVIAVRRLTQAS